MIDRRTLLLLSLLPTSLLVGSEIGRLALRRILAKATGIFLGVPVTLQPPADFMVGGATYQVDFWCTPAVLWTGAALLLYRSASGYRDYWRKAAWLLPLAALAMAANVVLSIFLHQRGVDWTWAHYPGLALIYAAVLLACLRQPAATIKHPELPRRA